MSKYKCSICEREFDEEEKQLTKDPTEKCILHCEKNFWYDVETFANVHKKNWEKSTVNIKFFWEKIRNTLNLDQNNGMVDFQKVVFPKFEENEDSDENFKMLQVASSGLSSIFRTAEITRSINFSNAIFLDDLILDNYTFTETLFFNNAIIDGDVNIKNSEFNDLFFYKTTFNKKVSLEEESTFVRPLFNSCNFNEGSSLIVSSSKIEGKLFEYRDGKQDLKLPKNIILEDSTFEEEFDLTNTNSDFNRIYIGNCKFTNDFWLYDTNKINIIFMNNNSFDKLFYLAYNNIQELNITQIDFKEIANLSNNTIAKFVCNNLFFNQAISFRRSTFNSNVTFQNIDFFHQVDFSNVKINGELDLRYASIYGEADFLDLEVNSIANRDTARKIKYSFEKIDNIIDANKYYAIEMRERSKELNLKNKPLEWLIFKIHEISSNHSQDWLLAVSWIILVGMLLSLFKINFVDSIPITFIALVPLLLFFFKKYMFLMFYGFFFLFMCTIDYSILDSLDKIAYNLNPFSIMTSADTISFVELLFKVIIAYLIYQFIVSVRQNTRRK